MKSMCQEARRNSPSVAERSPTSFCIWTTSRMASSSAAPSSTSEIWPAACFWRASRRDLGRSRLPTWSARNGGLSRMGMTYPARALLHARRVAVVVLLPGRPVLLVPARPVDATALESVLEMIEVEVPAGEDLDAEVLGRGRDVGEPEDAAVAVLAE